jgi:hypothetical protein
MKSHLYLMILSGCALLPATLHGATDPQLDDHDVAHSAQHLADEGTDLAEHAKQAGSAAALDQTQAKIDAWKAKTQGWLGRHPDRQLTEEIGYVDQCVAERRKELPELARAGVAAKLERGVFVARHPEFSCEDSMRQAKVRAAFAKAAPEELAHVRQTGAIQGAPTYGVTQPLRKDKTAPPAGTTGILWCVANASSVFVALDGSRYMENGFADYEPGPGSVPAALLPQPLESGDVDVLAKLGELPHRFVDENERDNDVAEACREKAYAKARARFVRHPAEGEEEAQLRFTNFAEGLAEPCYGETAGDRRRAAEGDLLWRKARAETLRATTARSAPHAGK